MPYETNPTRPHVVLTPDGGIIECLHEAAAHRVCAELNALLEQIEEIGYDLAERDERATMFA